MRNSSGNSRRVGWWLGSAVSVWLLVAAGCASSVDRGQFDDPDSADAWTCVEADTPGEWQCETGGVIPEQQSLTEARDAS